MAQFRLHGTRSHSLHPVIELAYTSRSNQIALWLLFVTANMLAAELMPAAGSAKAYLLYKRGGGGQLVQKAASRGTTARDEEEGQYDTQIKENRVSPDDKPAKELENANSIFTWRNLFYTVRRSSQ